MRQNCAAHSIARKAPLPYAKFHSRDAVNVALWLDRAARARAGDPAVYVGDGVPAAPGQMGELVVRQPWVGETQGFWQDDERYLESYWSRWPGVWVHGDWAAIDEDGLWYILGRSDDTIKIAGKRVGPAEVESVLVEHPRVLEAAAIGVPDELKGQALVCFCVLRPEPTPPDPASRTPRCKRPAGTRT